MKNGKQQDIRGLLILSSLTYLWIAIHLVLKTTSSQIALPSCWFKEITGIPCGGCGMTTATLEMLHGHVFTAFQINPLGPIFFILATIIWVWALIDKLQLRNSLGEQVEIWNERLKKPMIYIPLIFLVVGQWLYNTGLAHKISSFLVP